MSHCWLATPDIRQRWLGDCKKADLRPRQNVGIWPLSDIQPRQTNVRCWCKSGLYSENPRGRILTHFRHQTIKFAALHGSVNRATAW